MSQWVSNRLPIGFELLPWAGLHLRVWASHFLSYLQVTIAVGNFFLTRLELPLSANLHWLCLLHWVLVQISSRGVFIWFWRHGCAVFSTLLAKQLNCRDLVPAPSLSSFIGTVAEEWHLVMSAAFSKQLVGFSSKHLWVFFPPCCWSFLFSCLLDLVVVSPFPIIHVQNSLCYSL